MAVTEGGSPAEHPPSDLDDLTRAQGIQNGINKALTAPMWDGRHWRPMGQILAAVVMSGPFEEGAVYGHLYLGVPLAEALEAIRRLDEQPE